MDVEEAWSWRNRGCLDAVKLARMELESNGCSWEMSGSREDELDSVGNLDEVSVKLGNGWPCVKQGRRSHTGLFLGIRVLCYAFGSDLWMRRSQKKMECSSGRCWGAVHGLDEVPEESGG